MSFFHQINEAQRTESLHPIGVISLEPDALAEHYGLTFQADEQDGSTAAMLVTGDGQQYMLLRHFDDPEPGTEVLASDTSTEPERDLEGLLEALDIQPDQVTWRLSREEALAARRQLDDRRGLAGT